MPRQKPLDGIKDQVPGLAHRLGEEAKRDRSWDEENPAFSFRIRARDAERLTDKAGELGLSKDALARALLWAALDALESGELALEIDEERTEIKDRLGRRRTYVRQLARPAWAGERKPKDGQ